MNIVSGSLKKRVERFNQRYKVIPRPPGRLVDIVGTLVNPEWEKTNIFQILADTHEHIFPAAKTPFDRKMVAVKMHVNFMQNICTRFNLLYVLLDLCLKYFGRSRLLDWLLKLTGDIVYYIISKF